MPESVAIPDSNGTVYEAIYRRRMAWRFKDQAVPHATIERLLATAIWAPNHRLTEPWRIFVLDQHTQMRKEAAELAFEHASGASENRARGEAARNKVLSAPVLVYVFSVPGPSEEATRENYAAVCCGIQNMALAGVAEGLAVTWETGGPTRHPKL